METIEYGEVITDNELGGYNMEKKKLIKVKMGDLWHELSQREIDYIRKELPRLLKNGESLHLTTHVDHDEYFVVEVIRSDKWPDNKYCEVRVMSYDGGCLQGGYSDWVELDNEIDVQEFVEDIFE